MRLQFLNPLYARPGPLASVHLDTSRDLDDPDRAIELRWRNLRERLLAHDADQATVGAIAGVIGTDRAVAGRHGQAIFAAHGRLVLAECLPEPPAQDNARYGIVPDALPLALQHTPDIPYAAVLVHRVHAVETDSTEDQLEIDHETGSWPATRVAPGERWFRRVPAEDWPKEAEQLVAQLVESVDSSGTEVIVLAGDPWGTNTVIRAAPTRLQDRFVRLRDGTHRRPEPGRALLEAELGALLTDRMSQHDQRLLDAFLAQRVHHRDEAEGLPAAVSALQRGQAQALVLNRPARPARNLWVGMAPNQLALSGADLKSFGLSYYWEEDGDAALIRATVGTRAELIAVPEHQLSLRDGVAVLLRYT